MEIFDCTLRDGSHAMHGGFPAESSSIIVKALLRAGIRAIEFGKASGIGSPKGETSDDAYLQAVAPMLGDGEIGMFCNPDFFGDEQYALATDFRLGFLRVGTHCAKVEAAAPVIERIRAAGIKARYSLIQAHMLSPVDLARSASKVEAYGAQAVTIMDSTGTMMPSQVHDYVSALVDRVDIPVGFHGHNNLGLSVANGIAAMEAGASSLDGALVGLARSAGNAPTEVLVTVLERMGHRTGIDVFALFDFIAEEFHRLAPAANGVAPIDIVFGMVGFHSRNLPVIETVASEEGLSLVRLVAETARLNQANYDLPTVRAVARKIGRTLLKD